MGELETSAMVNRRQGQGQGQGQGIGRALLTVCFGASLAVTGFSNAGSPLASSEDAESVARTAEVARALARDVTGAKGAILGALMFYDPIQDIAGGVDGAAYGPGDRAWVEAALGVYDLYRQIGGEAGSRRYLFRRDTDRVFVGVVGGTGHWHPSVEAGQAAFLRLLVGASRALPKSLRQAALRGSDRSLGPVVQDLVAVLSEPGKVLMIPAGASRELRLDEAWHVVGTAGLDVSSAPTGEGGVIATVRRGAGDSIGAQAILAFKKGHRFSANEAIDVAVAGEARARGLGDGTATEAPGSATPDRLDPRQPAPVPGAIATSGETRRYTISIPATGGYRIQSAGPSDVAASLKDPDGAVIASDDDGGVGYNFNFEATLEAGDYTLEVVHCCAGTGPFSLTVSPK
jgi:hypothetical protein